MDTFEMSRGTLTLGVVSYTLKCPYFRGTLLYVAVAMHGVLIKGGVPISGVRFSM